MKAITHFEVYVVKHGHWALHARLSGNEHDKALDTARHLEADTERATQVIEESLEPEAERLTVRVIAAYGHAPTGTQGPSTDSNIGSRIFMVLLNAFGIGAIGTVIMAVALSSLRGSAVGNTFNMLLLFTFAALALTAGLTLFKIYVPMEWILWRGKSAESQRRAIDVLLHGNPRETTPAWQPAVAEKDAEPETVEAPSPVPPPHDAPADLPAPPRLETNADQGEQTSFHITSNPQPSAAESEAPAESLAESAAAVINAALAKELEQLTAFADAGIAALMATRQQLQAFERVGLNLYLAGAAAALAERAGFSDNIRNDLLKRVLEHSGTNAAIADIFIQRLDGSLERPRFRKLMEAGRAAMTAMLDNNPTPGVPALPDLMLAWADAATRGAEVKKVTFLLTDIVGSTALTSKVGNAGAQRVVRAHDSAARGAAKNFRGTEVKHTGDGLLLTFPDAAAAGRAAMEMQQSAINYARDNPEAPLILRIGIHTGEATIEDGEYYGPALAMLNGVCSAAGETEIFCSEEAKSRAVGPVFRFQDMGKRKLKDGTDAQLFRLEFTPKTKAPGPLEYRQIGGKTPAPAR